MAERDRKKRTTQQRIEAQNPGATALVRDRQGSGPQGRNPQPPTNTPGFVEQAFPRGVVGAGADTVAASGRVAGGIASGIANNVTAPVARGIARTALGREGGDAALDSFIDANRNAFNTLTGAQPNQPQNQPRSRPTNLGPPVPGANSVRVPPNQQPNQQPNDALFSSGFEGDRPQPGSAIANSQQRVENFSVPGVEGTASVIRGSGNNERAKELLSQRIAADTADGLQRAANRNQLEDEARARARAGGGQSAIGGFGGRLRAIDERRQQLQDQINFGLTTNSEGNRLTVGGLRALQGELASLDDFEASLLGDAASNQRSAASDEAGLQRQILASQGQLANTQLQGQNSLAGIQARINDPLNQARARAAEQLSSRLGIEVTPPAQLDPDFLAQFPPEMQAQLQRQQKLVLQGFDGALDVIGQNGGDVLAAREDIVASIDEADTPEEAQQATLMLRELDKMIGTGGGAFIPRQQEGPQLANGGLVQSFAQGGLVGPNIPGGTGQGAQLAGSGAPQASIQNYQQYVQTAQKMGVQPVPFDQFAALSAQVAPPSNPPLPQLQQGAQGSQQVLGFAGGGIIPDPNDPQSALASAGTQVDGQVVTDPNQDAPVDSIPAVIDGEQPAALDSGEFVLPADVVLHFGTEKLIKMIQAARGQKAGGGAIQGAQPNASA